MNGAEAIIGTLAAAGTSVCFANPGTSELHLVDAIERCPQVHGVLCLFEGVAAGAADGFSRMVGTPALALLHQGPGLAYALANLHNARRAEAPVVAIVGASATTHSALDAPLETDLPSLARPMSTWVGVAHNANDAAAAWAAAMRSPRGPATLIVPADVAWAPATHPMAPTPTAPTLSSVPEDVLRQAARDLRGPRTALLLGGAALSAPGQAAADRIALATGTRVLTDPFPARQRRGADTASLDRLSGDAMLARTQLAGVERLLLAGITPPVAAFARPGARGQLWPTSCALWRLDEPGQDVVAMLEELAKTLAAPHIARTCPRRGRDEARPDSPLDAIGLARIVADALPEEAVVVDETNTMCGTFSEELASAAPHDLLGLRGFAIGQGLPLATGAAIAGDRPVVCLEADGSALYTLSALWTQAREGTNVTTVILDNHGYAILRRENHRMLGAEAINTPLFDLSNPELDFVALAAGMGVPATRAETSAQMAKQFSAALAEPGPHLIHAVVTQT